MKKWELKFYYVSFGGYKIEQQIKNFYGEQKVENTDTEWGELQQIAKNGWELVSVSPYNINGTTSYLLYTFKRTIDE